MSELENDALAAIAAAGMAIEINTSGLDRYPVAEMFPSASLLRRARAAGIGLTFGSDAHRAAEVGSHFAQALQWARAAGYESFLRLSDRVPVALPGADEPLPARSARTSSAIAATACSRVVGMCGDAGRDGAVSRWGWCGDARWDGAATPVGMVR